MARPCHLSIFCAVRGDAVIQHLPQPAPQPCYNLSVIASNLHHELTEEVNTMHNLTRITFNPAVMGGKPCIRGLRVTAGTLVGLIASGYSVADILGAYPYLEADDIWQALAYAAWRAEEIELPLVQV